MTTLDRLKSFKNLIIFFIKNQLRHWVLCTELRSKFWQVSMWIQYDYYPQTQVFMNFLGNWFSSTLITNGYTYLKNVSRIINQVNITSTKLVCLASLTVTTAWTSSISFCFSSSSKFIYHLANLVFPALFWINMNLICELKQKGDINLLITCNFRVEWKSILIVNRDQECNLDIPSVRRPFEYFW